MNTTKERNIFIWGPLSFFLPYIGPVLFIAWHKTKPKAARAALWETILFFIIGIILTIIYLALLGYSNRGEY